VICLFGGGVVEENAKYHQSIRSSTQQFADCELIGIDFSIGEPSLSPPSHFHMIGAIDIIESPPVTPAIHEQKGDGKQDEEATAHHKGHWQHGSENNGRCVVA